MAEPFEIAGRLRKLAIAVREQRADDCKRILQDVAEDLSYQHCTYGTLFETAALSAAAAGLTGDWHLVASLFSQLREHPGHVEEKQWLQHEAELYLGYALIKSGECQEGLAVLEALVAAQPSKTILLRLANMLAVVERDGECQHLGPRLRRLGERVRGADASRVVPRKKPGRARE